MVTVTLRPNANGAIIGLTPYPATLANWDCVDEAVANDAVDYVWIPDSPNFLSLRDFYLKPASGIPAGSMINSVTHYRRIRYRGFTYGSLYIAGNVYDFDGARVLAAWTTRAYTLTTSPATGAPWTLAEVENMQVGVRLDNVYDPIAEMYVSPLCTQVYIVVDYTPPVAVRFAGDGLAWVVA